MARLKILSYGREIELEDGETVLNALNRAGITIPHECGGNGICGTCRVHVRNGADGLAAALAAEAIVVQRFKSSQLETRLACQLEPKKNISIELL